MQRLTVNYYDGRSNVPFSALLMPSNDGLVVEYNGQRKHYLKKQLHFIGGVARVLPAIELPDDARIEFLSQDIPDWVNAFQRKFYHLPNLIEKRWAFVFLAFCFTLGVIFSVIKWGMPAVAKQVAFALPEDSLVTIGDQAQEFIIQQTGESELGVYRRQGIIELYQKHVPNTPKVNIIFRKGGEMGANALAIPNNSIIVTDELVKLAENDQEILAVLAHEHGHLVERHSLQQALRALGVSAIYVAITGDASDLFGSIPLALVSAQYSQEFEFQADHHAAEILQSQNIPPQHLANFLLRLEQDVTADQTKPSVLEGAFERAFGSHPETLKRVEAIQQFQANP
ncbi:MULTISPECIES: M48 family metallopeptidase [unclassified Acinetobacter]|uniref:M48 family metallopeptidase n=1 Tax=unclassified Acinetobacter TaxID=196816 RepID=UPI0035B995F9